MPIDFTTWAWLTTGVVTFVTLIIGGLVYVGLALRADCTRGQRVRRTMHVSGSFFLVAMAPILFFGAALPHVQNTLGVVWLLVVTLLITSVGTKYIIVPLVKE